MSKINVKELKSLTEEDHGNTLRETGGLVGRVRSGVNGVTVIFRYEIWLHGKKRDYALGSWPKKSLTFIRAERNYVHNLIVDGIDPNEARKEQRVKRQWAVKKTIRPLAESMANNITVRSLFNSWIQDGVARQDGNRELNRLFAKDILPMIGKTPLRKLNDKDILVMLRQMLARGITRQVVIAYNDTNQMLSWGEKREPWRNAMINGNPCDLISIKKLLPIDYEEERNRILSNAEVRELYDIFQRMDRDCLTRPVTKKTQIALWLCLGTICRIGELLQARWGHVDLERGVWFIPRENVKGTRNKKQEHYIFLSDFTQNQFAALKESTGQSEWCFPSKNHRELEMHVCLKSISKQVGDRQVKFKNRKTPLRGRAFNNDLVLSNGVNGEWTPHDLRRTGATMMQALGVSLDVIDRCQNHVISGSRVRRHYLHYDYRKEKTEAWQKLGNKITAIIAGQTDEVK